MSRPKIIFVSGGVISGIGKGVATSAIALLLKSRGFSVTAIKADPYLNSHSNPTGHEAGPPGLRRRIRYHPRDLGFTGSAYLPNPYLRHQRYYFEGPRLGPSP